MGIDAAFKSPGEGGRQAGTCQDSRPGQDPCFPPASFITFILSLAQSAMVLMGEAPEPESGAYIRNLPQAKHTIDILAMLDCKTRGNLGQEEREVLETLLCELRLAYVKKQ
ncbi:protein of unknown function DUF1844 [Solidesulfovibrio carbinoliphilus subsp. oakridgensis]|uniref:DUF1844 domain-containing protein n=1 Tax=Solidesulfovibrio carbinoliphilus subsp. oakridgensis TaxID=694327 RepID=G7QAW2_9BACT|nr:DUF1844 domain-containing protein [Solidesulfovibrio carbinoliphilus]EHJ48303.1 protein of unknown function DUF1844 [Solidesulfovibrio carbinoliphilus subsp. oakridgensis]